MKKYTKKIIETLQKGLKLHLFSGKVLCVT